MIGPLFLNKLTSNKDFILYVAGEGVSLPNKIVL